MRAERWLLRTSVGYIRSHKICIDSSLLVLLSERGHKLTYQLANSPDVVIYKYGEYVYDNVLLMCPGTEDFATLDIPSIVTFVEKVSP